MSSPKPQQRERVLKATLESSLLAYQDFVQSALDALSQLGWTQCDLFAVHTALEESISNAIRHGNKESPDKVVEVECRLSAERFWVQVCDQGPGFQPSTVPDCCSAERLEVPGGRGLKLMEAFMTSIQYNDRGNCVTLEKRRAAG
jgi:serine/threonine-protein kinase RsbW